MLMSAQAPPGRGRALPTSQFRLQSPQRLVGRSGPRGLRLRGPVCAAPAGDRRVPFRALRGVPPAIGPGAPTTRLCASRRPLYNVRRGAGGPGAVGVVGGRPCVALTGGLHFRGRNRGVAAPARGSAHAPQVAFRSWTRRAEGGRREKKPSGQVMSPRLSRLRLRESLCAS